MHPQTIARRYQVLSLLGEGGMGMVYRCLDQTHQREIALKTLTVKNNDSEKALWRFRREFAAMQRLEHQHCVRAFEFGHDADFYFFTMEFIDGVPFNKLKGNPIVLPLSLEVLLALDYIHGQGIIHRDLKPHNVLVAQKPSQRAVLADFGIAKVLDVDGEEQQLTSAGGVLGTLAYLSPEQAEGKPVDPRADLYSFGVLLYESLLGVYPYVLPKQLSPVDYLRAHVIDPPVPPKRIRPDLPDGLSQVLLQLLAKAPDQRLPSAAATFEALKPFTGADAIPNLVLTDSSYLLNAKLVGRDRELSLLLDNIRNALSPNRAKEAVLFVCGDSGIGKTRLLEELGAQLRRQGVAVYSGLAEEGSPDSFGAWLPVLRQLLEEHGEGGVSSSAPEQTIDGGHAIGTLFEALPSEQSFADDSNEIQTGLGHQSVKSDTVPNSMALNQAWGAPERDSAFTTQERALLQQVLPEFRVPTNQSIPSLPAISLEAAAQERWAMLRGLADLLAAQGAKKKICILLEDIHAAEESSIDLLLFLARAVSKNPKRPSLVVVATYRNDEITPYHPLRQLNSKLLAEGLSLETSLGPLSLEASVAFIAASLGMEPTPQLKELAQRLYQTTAGNPSYLTELLKTLIADGRLQRKKGKWQFDNAIAGGNSLLPENFKELLRRRLMKLPQEVKELLEVFAAIGRVASLDVLLTASGLNEEELLNRLDDGVRAKLIEEVEAGASAFRFLNEPIRETLYDDLPPGRKRILHSKIAAALGSLGGSPGELARHFLKAGEKSKARNFFIKAGDNALRAFDGSQAAIFYQEALTLAGEDATLEERLGRSFDLCGKLPEAEEALTKSLTREATPPEKARRLRALAEVKRKKGSMAEAAVALEQAMEIYGKPLPKSRMGVLGSIVGQGLRRAVHNMGIKGSVKEEEKEVEAQIVRLAASLAHTLYYVDYEKSVAAHLFMLNEAERLGPSEELALAYIYHGAGLGTTGDFKSAADFLQKGRALAEERKARPLVERAGAYDVWLSWTQGEVKKSAEQVDQILQKSSPKDPFDLATVLYVGAASRVARGEFAKARAYTGALERLALETQSRYTNGTARLHLGAILVAQNDLNAAGPILEEARQSFLDSNGRVYAIASAAYMGIVLARSGKVDEAIALFEETEKDMEKFHVKDPLVLLHAFFAEALFFKAMQAPDAKTKQRWFMTARSTAKQAIKWAKLFPIQLPMANRIAAAIERESGQVKAAQELLEEATAMMSAKEIRYPMLFQEGS